MKHEWNAELSPCFFCVVISAYKDLQTREDIRNAAWHKHGWEELVYYTGTIFYSSHLLFFIFIHLEANIYFF